MEFRIADTFTDSLAKLTGEEQKAVKTTAFDLQMNPANPGMQFHKLDKAKDKNFWSVRVSSDIRHDRPQDQTQACFCVTWTTTMMPTAGLNGASWKPIPKPAPRSWWRSGRGWRRSSFPSTWRRNSRSMPSRPCLQMSLTMNCSAMACPKNGWGMFARRR